MRRHGSGREGPPTAFGAGAAAGGAFVARADREERRLLTGWLADTGIPVRVVRGFGSQPYADVVRDRATAGPPSGVLLLVGAFATGAPLGAMDGPVAAV